MKKVSQFEKKSRGKSVKIIKTMVNQLLKDVDKNDVYTKLANNYEKIPMSVKAVIVRELKNTELGYCSVQDYLEARYVIFNMTEREKSSTIDLIIKLTLEIIGIRLFKLDTRKYVSLDGAYVLDEMLFDCISLNYKSKSDVEQYTSLIEQKVMKEVEEDRNVDENIYPVICDIADSMYWRNVFNNMIITTEGSGFKLNTEYFAGKELYLEDIDFSKRNSINPVITTIRVFDREINIKEFTFNNLHFILAGTKDETVVIPTQFPTSIIVKDIILVGAVLQYYKLKDSGIRYKMPQGVKDDNKVTRVNRKAKSREEMIAVQEKWNFSIGEEETIFRKALLG